MPPGSKKRAKKKQAAVPQEQAAVSQEPVQEDVPVTAVENGDSQETEVAPAEDGPSKEQETEALQETEAPSADQVESTAGTEPRETEPVVVETPVDATSSQPDVSSEHKASPPESKSQEDTEESKSVASEVRSEQSSSSDSSSSASVEDDEKGKEVEEVVEQTKAVELAEVDVAAAASKVAEVHEAEESVKPPVVAVELKENEVKSLAAPAQDGTSSAQGSGSSTVLINHREPEPIAGCFGIIYWLLGLKK